MNNKIFLIFLLSLLNVLSVKALALADTMIILDEQNVRGERQAREVVIIKGDHVYVNREQLSPSEIITQSAHITQIASFPSKVRDRPCSSGSFLHILKKENVIKKEKGCLSSERYKILKKHFRSLKKDHITN